MEIDFLNKIKIKGVKSTSNPSWGMQFAIFIALIFQIIYSLASLVAGVLFVILGVIVSLKGIDLSGVVYLKSVGGFEGVIQGPFGWLLSAIGAGIIILTRFTFQIKD